MKIKFNDADILNIVIIFWIFQNRIALKISLPIIILYIVGALLFSIIPLYEKKSRKIIVCVLNVISIGIYLYIGYIIFNFNGLSYDLLSNIIIIFSILKVIKFFRYLKVFSKNNL